MDYEAMSTPDLQRECRRRGLPSGRVKAELMQRLTEADAQSDEDGIGDAGVHPGGLASATEGGVKVQLAEGECVLRPDVQVVAQPDLLPPVPEPFTPREPEPAAPSTFRRVHRTGPGGLDEATHAKFRDRTRQAAVEAGHTPRGDAYRVGTTADGEVYEINVRRRF
jgi:hypothetical protein